MYLVEVADGNQLIVFLLFHIVTLHYTWPISILFIWI